MSLSIKSAFEKTAYSQHSQKRQPILSQQQMWERLYATHQRPIYQKMLVRNPQSTIKG